VTTTLDFEVAMWHWKLIADKQYLRIDENDEVKWYCKNNQMSEYNVTAGEFNVEEEEMIAIVRQFSRNRLLHISGKFSLDPQETARQVEPVHQEENVVFNTFIEEAITNRRAIAAVDTSIDESFMAAYWIVTTLDEAEKYTDAITSSKWIHGAIPIAEGLGLYNLIKEINSQT